MRMGVFTAFSGGKIFSGFPGFSAPAERGARTAAGGFALTGRLLFCTGQPGCANCRRRVRPFRAESFSLNLSGGFAVCGRRERCGARRGGAKRKDNLRFSFLFELLPFPLLHSLTQTRERRPLRKIGTAVGLLLRLFRKIFAVHRQRTATQTVYSTQARHTRAAQFVSLEVADSTYGLGVRYNLSSQVLSIITR